MGHVLSRVFELKEILDSPWKPKNKIKNQNREIRKKKYKMERVNSQEVKEDEEKTHQDCLTTLVPIRKFLTEKSMMGTSEQGS